MFGEYAKFKMEDCQSSIAAISYLPLDVKNSACEHLKNRKITFNIMDFFDKDKNCKKTIFINGENHEAHPSLRMPMYKMGASFPVRLVEGAWDFERVKGAETIHSIFDERKLKESDGSIEQVYETWKEHQKSIWSKIFNYNKTYPVGSPIKDMAKDLGIFTAVDKEGRVTGEFNYGEPSEVQKWKGLLTGIDNLNDVGVRSCSAFRVNDLESGDITVESFVGIYSSFIGKKDFPPITITSEYGKLSHYDFDCTDYSSKSCKEYVIAARDARAANNINDIVKEMPCSVPMSITFGLSHVPGLRSELIKRGFKDSDSVLSSYSYLDIKRKRNQRK